MAVYKVPQDVEAEDKLIGPFGFRQFIYLIVAAFFGFVAFLLAGIFIGLALIPAPLIFFFIGIALPLRKDQPTEVYLAAVLQYHLKPKRRMWKPEGVTSLVEILAPRVVEDRRIKDLTEDQAVSQFEHLSQILDTRGWAGRNVLNSENASSASNIKFSDATIQEADQTEDMMDDSSKGAKSFDSLLVQQQKISLEEARQRMKQASSDVATEAIKSSASPSTPAPQLSTEPQAPPAPVAKAVKPTTPAAATLAPAKQPPQTAPPAPPQPPQSTSVTPLQAAIIEPVNDDGLTIATIAAQARRRAEQSANEVVVKLH